MTRVIGAALAALLGAALLVAPVTATASTATPTPAPTTAAAPQESEEGVAPIAVLLDTSGSMNEDDGAGTLKLRGAKNAVRDIVRNLSSTTVFSLRTYPASGGCDDGRYVYEPAPLTNPDAVLSSVEGITADGSTPTGEALRALADDLKARGYMAATIVLVSDGESTCSTPPCDVAKQLVSEGFDVTVPTIGFRTSAAGSKELACVAEATGGVYLDAGDSAELAEQLDSLVRAQLELKVRFDATPMSGGSTKITAVITHKGGEGAKDVRVALTFRDAGASVVRAAVPPMVRVGNIPAGQTVERSWTVGTGARGTSRTTQFIASAWGTNAVKVQFQGEYTPKTPKYTKDELGPLFEQVSNETPLVIFGDSYSSGEGIGSSYQQVPDGVSMDCHRNQETYLGTVFSVNEMRIVACSGAVTEALKKTSNRSNMSQIQEMESRGIVPGAGAVTFGGNNILFAEVIAACINPLNEPLANGCGNLEYGTAKIDEAKLLPGTLSETYKVAWSALNTAELREKRGGSYVPLLVLPYPKVTHEPQRGACYSFNAVEVALADALAGALNDSIETAVNTVRAEGYEVYYVSDVEDAVRPDNTLCSIGPLAYINDFIPAVDRWPPAQPESVHPKRQGYAAETDAIIRWVGSAEEITPTVSDGAINANLEGVADPVEIIWPTPVNFNKPSDDMLLIRGGAIAPTGSGFAAGTPVTTALHSDPVILGSLMTDENGEVNGTLRIPADTPPGQHTLVVSGLDENGEFIEKRIPVSVVFPTPWWVWGTLALGPLLLLAALALVLLGLSGRRKAALQHDLP